MVASIAAVSGRECVPLLLTFRQRHLVLAEVEPSTNQCEMGQWVCRKMSRKFVKKIVGWVMVIVPRSNDHDWGLLKFYRIPHFRTPIELDVRKGVEFPKLILRVDVCGSLQKLTSATCRWDIPRYPMIQSYEYIRYIYTY